MKKLFTGISYLLIYEMNLPPIPFMESRKKPSQNELSGENPSKVSCGENPSPYVGACGESPSHYFQACGENPSTL